MTDYPVNEAGLEPNSACSAFADPSTPGPALPVFDVANYRSHLASFDLTADQERELLETVWAIMYSFVELGFTMDVCSAIFDGAENVADLESGGVKSLNQIFSERSSNNTAEKGPS